MNKSKPLLTKKKVVKYLNLLHKKGYSDNTIKRKTASLLKFTDYAFDNKLIHHSQFQEIKNILLGKKPNFTLNLPKPKIAGFKALLPKFKLANFLGLFLLIAFAVGSGIGIYNQFFRDARINLAAQPGPVRAGRIINFQGFLTDSNGTPIVSPINMRYKLYNAASGGDVLYDTGSCSVNPDNDGIVNVLIGTNSPAGGACWDGGEIPAEVFSMNPNVYLGVTVGTDPEMTDRQQIANVGYAINAELLQGYPLGTSSASVPFINSDGDLLIAATTPSVSSINTSANFRLSSANAITIASAGSGDILLQASESGAINLRTGGITDTYSRLFINNAGNVGIGTTAPGYKLDVNGDVRVGTLASGSTDTVVTHSSGVLQARTIDSRVWGSTLLDGSSLTANYLTKISDSNTLINSLVFDNGTNVGIGTTSPGAKLEISDGANYIRIVPTSNIQFSRNSANYIQAITTGGYFNFIVNGATPSDANASLTIQPDNDVIIPNGNVGIGTTAPSQKLEVAGDILATNLRASTDLYIAGTALSANTSTTSGASLVGLYDDSMAYISGNTNVQSAIKQLDTAIGSVSSTASGWTDDGTVVRLSTISDRVGIGTTSPNASTKLGILGGVAIGSQTYSDAAAPTNGLIVEGNVGIGTTSPLGMLDVGSGKLLVTSGGNIGIGTISPGAKLDIVPSSSSDIVFRTKSLQSTAPLGSELVSNGDFSTVPDTAWTWGTGWTHDTTNFEADHTTGNTAALTQNISVTNGQTYQVEITIKNRTAGSVTLDINGVYIYNYGSVTTLNSNTTYQRSLVANITGTATLSITPTSDFNGSVDNITVKQITGVSQPNFALLDDAGSVMAEIRGKNSLGNIALGTNALRLNTTGSNNSAIGANALYANTTGSSNSAIGANALRSNTTGYNNLAIGANALFSNTTGYYNSAIGESALRSNTTGSYNSAIGANALYANTTGSSNSAIGMNALYSNTTGSSNSAIGYQAGRYITGNAANQTSNTSVYLGAETKAYADGDSNEIVIGYNTTGFGSNSAAYGNSSMTKHIFQAGNVGIGTTAPGYKLDVNGDARVSTLASGSTDTVVTHSSGVLQSRTIDSRVWGSTLLDGSSLTTNYLTKVSDSNTLVNSLVFDNGTNVGIGTTSPSYTLDVNGDIYGTNLRASTDLYIAGTALSANTSITSGASKVGLYDDSMTYISGNTNVQSAIKQLDTAIGSVSSTAGGWTDDGTVVSLTTTSDLVSIGDTTTEHKLEVEGAITGKALVSLWEKGDQDILVASNSATPTNVLRITNNGSVISQGNITASSGTITGGTLTDGTASLTSGNLTGVVNLTMSGTLDLGTNTIYDGNLTGNWNFNSGNLSGIANLTTTGTITTGLTTGVVHADSSGVLSSVLGTANYFSRWTSTGLSSTSNIYEDASGNIGIGTTTPAAKLQVNSTSQQLKLLYSGSNSLNVTVGSAGNTTFSATAGAASTNNMFTLTTDNYGAASVLNLTATWGLTATSGNQNALQIPVSFTPTSGTATFTALSITPTINQTGGANGISRGIYINPTLTSAADWRSIEVATGNVLFNTTSGSVGIGTTAPTYKLDVNGDVRVGTLASGSTDTVVTHSSGVLQSRSIDSRVWGSTLLDGSSLTANYLTKVSDSNTLINSLVFDDGTNVGIGTTVPTKGKLNVLGSVAIGSTAYTETSGAAPTNGLIVEGNVGIGTTAPEYKLSVNGAITSTSFKDYAQPSYHVTPGSAISAALIGNVGIGTTSPAANLHIYNDDLDPMILAVNNALTAQFVVTSTGNMGIGTTAPQYPITINTAGSSNGWAHTNDSITLASYIGPTYGKIYTISNHALRLGVNNTMEIMTLNNNGSTGIFDTSPEAIFEITGTGTSDSELFMISSVAANDGDIMTVKRGGNIGIGTISPGAKLDIVPSSSSDIVFRTKSLQSTAPLGSELVSNGDFSTVPDTAWTWGTGWTHDTTNFEADHTTGNTAALTQNISVTNGQTYQVEITIKNRTAGSVTLDINGVYIYNYGSVTTLNSNTTYQRSLVANITGTATLSITPTSDFNGSVDNITVKQITGVSQPNFALLDDAGSVMAEIRGKNSLGNIALGTNALRLNTTGSNNSAIGANALYANTTGSSNSAIGMNALYSNTTGSSNSAIGANALRSNTTGYNNLAIGANALFSNTTGYYNSAIGESALRSNTTGSYNSAIGANALYSNTTGSSNSAIGANALYFNTTGYNNLAIGVNALRSNTNGYRNSAIGVGALYSNTTGSNNSAIGESALYSNTTGNNNSAIGYNAGRYITGGSTANQTSNTSLYLGAETKAYADGDSNEIVIGYNTTGFGSNSAAYGNSSMTKHIFQAGNVGIGTTAPGYKLDVSGNIRATGETIGTFASGSGQFRAVAGNYGIFLRNDGTNTYFLLTDSGNQYGSWNSLRPLRINDAGGHVSLGNDIFYVVHNSAVGIGTTVPSGILDVRGGVFMSNLTSQASTGTTLGLRIETTGELKVITSSRRYKENIVDLNVDINKVLNLRPVNYTEIGTGLPGIGLIAEEVYDLIPELVPLNRYGQPESVFYELLPVYQHKIIKQNYLDIQALKTNFATLQKDLALTSTGDLNIVQNPSGEYQVQKADGSIVDRIATLAEVVVGNIKTGFINTKELIVETYAQIKGNLVVQGNLTAQTITSPTITNLQSNIQNLTTKVNDLQTTLNEVLAKDINTGQYFMDVAALESINLTVTDTANLNFIVAHNANIANVQITGNTIATSLFELKLEALNQITFFDQKVIVAKDGSITAKGEIVTQKGIKVINEAAETVASIDASGSAYFAEGITFDKNIASSSAVIAASQTFSEIGENVNSIITNGEASGQAVLPAGQQELLIRNGKVKENSLIYISPEGSTSGQVLYLDTKKENEWFKVKVDEPASTDIKFNWWIL